MASQAELKAEAQNLASKILMGRAESLCLDPFKHFLLDNAFTDSFVDSALTSFPNLDDQAWERTEDLDIEIKYRSKWKSEFDVPDGIVDVVRILNSSIFLEAMSEVMEIPKIIPDSYFSGGGLNVTTKNGLLDVHVDGNYHDATGLNRRINALLYLNKGWKSEYGGEFGMYDSMGETCIKKVDPIFNRLVIFETHDKSFHGLPTPLNVPDGINRKSILLYYYTVAKRPSEYVVVEEPHSALWRNRNFLDKRGSKTRNFK